MTFAMTISEREEKEFCEFLHGRIKEHNNTRSAYHRAARQPGAIMPLQVILKDQVGNFMGGLAASTYWGWLEIDDFYVPEELRGKGIGAALLQEAEKIAAQRGCTSCFLSTFEFQARAFYELHGYEVVGKLEDYPPGSAFYWMRKNLPAAQSDLSKGTTHASGDRN